MAFGSQTMAYFAHTNKIAAVLAYFLLLITVFLPKAHASTPKTHGSARLRAAQDEYGDSKETRFFQYLRLDSQEVFWEQLSLNIDLRNEIKPRGSVASQNDHGRFQLNAASLFAEGLPLGASLRAGRQYFYGAETAFNFDGAALEFKPFEGTRAGAFLGRPPAFRGQRIADDIKGGFLALGDARLLLARLDAARLAYRKDFPEHEELGLSATHRQGPEFGLTARLSYADRKPKSASLRAQFGIPEFDVSVQPSYFKQLWVADPAATRLSPYAETMAYHQRFERFGLSVSKIISNRLSVSLGAETERPINRQRYFAGLATPGAFYGFTAALTLSRLVNPITEDTSSTGSVGYNLGNFMEVSGGASVNEVKGNGFSLNENGGLKNKMYFANLKFYRSRFFEFSVSPSRLKLPDGKSFVDRLEIANTWRF